MAKHIDAILEQKHLPRYWWLKSIVRKYWALELSIVILLIIRAGLAIAIPYSLQKVFDLAIVGRNLNVLKMWGAILIGVPLMVFVLYIAFNFLCASLTNRFTVRCRSILYDAWFDMPDKYVHHIHGGEILSRMGQDMNTISNFMGVQVLNAISSVISFIVISIYLFTLEPLLLFIALLVVPIFCLVATKFGRQLVLTNTWARNTADKLLDSIHQVIRAFRYVKSRDTFLTEKRQFFHHARQAGRADIASNIVIARFSAYSTLLLTLGSTWVVLAGVVLIKGNRLSIGGLVAFMTCFNYLVSPLSSIVSCWIQTKQFGVSLGRLDDFISSYKGPSIKSITVAKRPTSIKSLRVHDISFSYDEKWPIFENVNMQIQRGQNIAIIGKSGAGKSTLCRLLGGVSKPTSGYIETNGVNIWGNIKHYRRLISYLPQELAVFNNTLYYNLTYGYHSTFGKNAEFLDTRLKKLIELFDLQSFVANLPNGYKTVLDNAEMRVSAGQKQRICLISVIVNDAEFYFLDEPSNALDVTNIERLIQVFLLLKKEGKTVVMFTHDRRLLRCCDQVYSFKGSKLTIGDYLAELHGDALKDEEPCITS
ncbi:MAG TPA: ABC transporter ATP-binding protein [Sedimentisphaerales bacterium]|nr:ABC transporter ATP-binding protein [Sedimentisphaerales bacterium]